MIRVKTVVLVVFLLGIWCRADGQRVAVKTNTLYWLTTTPNAEVEFAFNRKFSGEALLAYNPWTFKDDKKMRFWLVQPEIKYWFCETFEGHFVGLHLHGAQYYGGFDEKRYDGYLAGGGFSYGYDWILSPHWNLEAEVGAGYARLWYKESPRVPCNKCFEDKHKDYYGLTRIAFSVSYIF